MNQVPKPTIAVLGSINMDLVVRCGDLPIAGQTIMADSFAEFCGGKGANQAVAAALAGGHVSMIGAVGSDAFAATLIEHLQDCDVNCDAVARHNDQASGVAVIAVDSRAQNSILVVPGANRLISPQGVRDAEATIQLADCLLIQLEIPMPAVLEGIAIARRHGTRIILDPAPVPSEIPPQLLDVDFVCPNESEAAMLTGMPVDSLEQARLAAEKLCRMGARNSAITLGAQGTLLYLGSELYRGTELQRGSESTLLPAPTVDAVDTTAAGDAFAGALAVRWAVTNDLVESTAYANVGGALAASRPGAQASIATHEQIQTLLGQHA